jgi:hypothetical protein
VKDLGINMIERAMTFRLDMQDVTRRDCARAAHRVARMMLVWAWQDARAMTVRPQ